MDKGGLALLLWKLQPQKGISESSVRAQDSQLEPEVDIECFPFGPS